MLLSDVAMFCKLLVAGGSAGLRGVQDVSGGIVINKRQGPVTHDVAARVRGNEIGRRRGRRAEWPRAVVTVVVVVLPVAPPKSWLPVVPPAVVVPAVEAVEVEPEVVAGWAILSSRRSPSSP